MDSSEGKLAMMAAIAWSLLLPIASGDERLIGSGREDMIGSLRLMPCLALSKNRYQGCVVVQHSYLSFDVV